MSSPNWEEHFNLYCLIYVFFLLSNIRYLNRTLEGTIATFGPFRQYSEKHLKVFFSDLCRKGRKVVIPSFARFARDSMIVVCNVSMFCTYILQLYTQI